MSLQQKLSLKLSQRLVMTPSLQQAIKLLQMTRLELRTVVTQELVENPVLEEQDDLGEEANEEASPAEEESADAGDGETEDSMEEIDLEAYFSDYFDGPSSGSASDYRELPPLENRLTREPDLYDHLLWQLHMTDVSDQRREIAELVIGNLNPDGFLMAATEEIVAMGVSQEQSEGYAEEEVQAALELVRGFDPSGVACRNLGESLIHQLDADGEPADSLVRRVIDEHWDLFLRRQFATIAKQLGTELSELEPVVEKIKTLETRPGRKFNSELTRYVEPDVAVLKVSGDYVIQLNDDGMPRLRISRAYRSMLQKLRSEKSGTEARQFIREKMRSAIWLIKSLDQRQRTIYKVAESIVRQQREFLDNGIEHMRPLVLRDVADDIEMHESTVSRVVSNKYIHTPRGLLPMKFFFHSGIDREYGGDISSLTVKKKLEKMIDSEDPHKPISDSALTKALVREGINIARRTVAKYRDEIGIPSSTARKQIF